MRVGLLTSFLSDCNKLSLLKPSSKNYCFVRMYQNEQKKIVVVTTILSKTHDERDRLCNYFEESAENRLIDYLLYG